MFWVFFRNTLNELLKKQFLDKLSKDGHFTNYPDIVCCKIMYIKGAFQRTFKSYSLSIFLNHYHPRMQVSNVFSLVCLSVQVITFEPHHIETSFLVCRYICTISR